MDGGGAGGIGRGPLTSGTTGTAGSAIGVGTTTSGKGCVTVTPERGSLRGSMRGSLRVIVTEETGGVMAAARAADGTCILEPTSSMVIWESEIGTSLPVWGGYVPSEEGSREERGSDLVLTGSGFLGMDILGFLETGSSSADFRPAGKK